MSIIITSQTAAANSNEQRTIDCVTLVASSGIATGEDCVISVRTEIDGWTDSGEVLSAASPTANLLGPVTFRLEKPSSSSAYGVEMTTSDANF